MAVKPMALTYATLRHFRVQNFTTGDRLEVYPGDYVASTQIYPTTTAEWLLPYVAKALDWPSSHVKLAVGQKVISWTKLIKDRTVTLLKDLDPTEETLIIYAIKMPLPPTMGDRTRTYSTMNLSTQGRWMDLLQFAIHMSRDRGWTFGQAKTRWDLDLLNNTNPQDEKGTFDGYAQRQYIITGEFGGAVAENYEEKNLTMEAKKLKKMTTEKMAEAVEALNQGHSNFLEPHLACAAASASHAAGVRNPLAQSVETPVLLSQSDVM